MNKEQIYHELISSLPPDAENLSTLLPDQALRLLHTFMDKIDKLEDAPTQDWRESISDILNSLDLRCSHHPFAVCALCGTRAKERISTLIAEAEERGRQKGYEQYLSADIGKEQL